jgi:hypothetical protein
MPQVKKHVYDCFPAQEAASLTKKHFLILNVSIITSGLVALYRRHASSIMIGLASIKPIYKEPLSIADIRTQTKVDIIAVKLIMKDGLMHPSSHVEPMRIITGTTSMLNGRMSRCCLSRLIVPRMRIC